MQANLQPPTPTHKKKVQAGNEWSNILPKFLQASKQSFLSDLDLQHSSLIVCCHDQICPVCLLDASVSTVPTEHPIPLRIKGLRVRLWGFVVLASYSDGKVKTNKREALEFL